MSDKPKCWDAICYAAGTVRGGAPAVMLTQADCIALTSYVIQLTARGMAEPQGAPPTRCRWRLGKGGPQCVLVSGHPGACDTLGSSEPQGAPSKEWINCPRHCTVDHEPVRLIPGQRCPECREFALFDR